MFDELFLTDEQLINKSLGKSQLMDLRAYKTKKPKAPTQNISSYSTGFGDTATQNGFNPSDYNKSQMQWGQNATQYAQNKIADHTGADTQARAYADNLQAQGLKRFKRTADDTFGAYQADNARRFGSLNNSSYDSALKRFGQATQEGLQDLTNQYDTNYQSALNDYQNYWNNQAGIGQNVVSNLYGLGNTLSGNALQSSNATNNFNQQNYAQQVAMYNAKMQADAMKRAALYQATGNAIASWAPKGSSGGTGAGAGMMAGGA